MEQLSSNQISLKQPRLARWGRVLSNNWLVIIALLFLVIWILLPFIWAISAAFKTPLEVYRTPPTIIPLNPTVEGWQMVFNMENLSQFWMNSIYISAATTGIVMVLSVMAGYAFAKYSFPLRTLLLLFILVPRILPRAGLMVPLYVKFANLDMINTYAALIISYVASGVPLCTWILSGSFQAVPTELQEAAEIDGCNLWQHLIHVYLPVALPGVVTAGTLTFVDAWNEFPFVLAFTQGPGKRTLPYQLYLLRTTEGLEHWPMVMAFVLMMIVPIIVVYLFFQRHVVNSMTSGALK